MTKWLLSKLRDSVWQGIGVILTLLLALASPFIGLIVSKSTDEEKMLIKGRLVILEQYEYDLVGRIAPERINIIIDGLSEVDVKVHRFKIGNKSENPILPEDFIEPLQVSIDNRRKIVAIQSDTRDIIARQSVSVEDRVTDFVDEYLVQYEKIYDRFVLSKWTKVNSQTYQLEPILLNPEEGMDIIIYSSVITKTDDSNYIVDDNSSGIDFSWSCRIVGIDCPAVPDYDVIDDLSEQPNLLQVSISHSGLSIYFIVVCMIVICVSTIWMGLFTGRFVNITKRHLILIVLIFALSLSTSEIIADWWFKGQSIEKQHFSAFILLLLHITLILYIAFPIIKNILEGKSKQL